MCTFPTLCRNTVGSYECDCPPGYANKGPKQSARCEGIQNSHSLTFPWNTVSPPKVDKSIRKLTAEDAPSHCSFVFVDSLRALSKSHNWPVGSWQTGHFEKKLGFSEEFSLKKPSTLWIYLGTDWSHWLHSFGKEWNSHHKIIEIRRSIAWSIV